MVFNTSLIIKSIKTFVVSILVGLSVLAGFYLLREQNKHVMPVIEPLGTSVVSVSVTPTTKQQPTSINIPKIKKNLPIQAALVHDNEWDMFDTSVAWLSTSSVPGEGNVILYAHNRQHLWADLYKLIPGDVIEVDQNNNKHTYVVIESRTVKPTDVDILLSKEDQLTLYTCEGSFDQKRRVVFAKPV